MNINTSLNDNFNLHRIERYLSLAWESGGVPVILLTKSDLVGNVNDYIIMEPFVHCSC